MQTMRTFIFFMLLCVGIFHSRISLAMHYDNWDNIKKASFVHVITLKDNQPNERASKTYTISNIESNEEDDLLLKTVITSQPYLFKYGELAIPNPWESTKQTNLTHAIGWKKKNHEMIYKKPSSQLQDLNSMFYKNHSHDLRICWIFYNSIVYTLYSEKKIIMLCLHPNEKIAIGITSQIKCVGSSSFVLSEAFNLYSTIFDHHNQELHLTLLHKIKSIITIKPLHINRIFFSASNNSAFFFTTDGRLYQLKPPSKLPLTNYAQHKNNYDILFNYRSWF